MNKQTKWLIGLVAFLMVANIGLVATIWLKKDDTAKSPRGDARNYLVEELKMDAGQQKKFDSLRKEHFKKIKNSRNMISFLREQLFRILKDKQKDEELKNQEAILFTQKIGELQKEIDLEIYSHFSRLRALLNKDQQLEFDAIIQDVLRMIGPGGPPPNGPPNDSREPPDKNQDGPPTDKPHY